MPTVTLGCAGRLQLVIDRLHLLVVARHAAQVVVHCADAVEREVDDDLRVGREPAEARDAFDDVLAEESVGRNRDDRRPAVLVAGEDDVDQVGTDERLAAAEGRPVQRRAEVLEDA